MEVKIRCHSCDGIGYIEETEFYLNEKIKVLCPECDGKGFVMAEKYTGEAEGFKV